MLPEKSFELGLYVQKVKHSWEERVRYRVNVVRRSDEGTSIRNLSFEAFRGLRMPEKHCKHMYGDLTMEGFVSDYSQRLIGYEPHYRDVHSIELAEAEKMVRTLRAWEAHQKRWWKKAGDLRMSPGICFMLFASFVGASFVVYQDCTKRTGGWSHDHHAWEFLTVERGTRLYEEAIGALEDAAQLEKQAKEDVA